MSSLQQPQTPVLLLKEGTTETKKEDAQKNNITAAKLIAQILKSSLGPRIGQNVGGSYGRRNHYQRRSHDSQGN